MIKHKPHIVNKWLRIFDDIERSGLSTVDYCKQKNISFKTIYTWRSKLRKVKLSSTNNHFQEVKLKDSPSKPTLSSKPSDSINIFINDNIRISVNEGFNELLLLKTIKVIDNAIC